jgi:hypothetical protein
MPKFRIRWPNTERLYKCGTVVGCVSLLSEFIPSFCWTTLTILSLASTELSKGRARTPLFRLDRRHGMPLATAEGGSKLDRHGAYTVKYTLLVSMTTVPS